MKHLIYDFIGNQEGLTPKQILLNILMSALFGIVIYISYAISHRGTIYSKRFNVSLLILSTLTGTVMTVIGNNVALSLGMVGALSIVRFRTALKDTRDTVYVFWTIVVGICCGVGDYLVAAIGSGTVFFLLLLFGSIKNTTRMLLIIRCDRPSAVRVKAAVFRLFHNKATLRVENTTQDAVELIYEVSSRLILKMRQKGEDLVSGIYACGKVEYVNIVAQNDEISG